MHFLSAVDSAAGRCAGRRLGAQAAPPGWLRSATAPRGSLYSLGRPRLADRRAGPGGIALGILDALIALVLADVMRGTGRYNAARGVVRTVQGVGGSLSNVVAGLIVVTAGYDTAFLALAVVALAAFLLMLAAMPDTVGKPPPERSLRA